MSEANNGNHRDPAAERACLASLFRGGFQSYAEVSDILNADDFDFPNNPLIYRCFEHVFDTPDAKVDIPGIMSAASELGFDDFLNNKNAVESLRAISAFPVDISNTRKYAQKVRKLSLYRQFVRELEAAKQEVGEATGAERIVDVLGKVESRVLDFGRVAEGQSNATEILGETAVDYIEDLIVSAKPMGIQTAFRRWDENIGGGLLPNSLELIGARTKTGKSLFSNAMMLSIARQGIPVFDVQTEMSTTEQQRRFIASMSGVVEREIRDGVIKDFPDKLIKVRAAAKELASLPIHHQNVGMLNMEGIVGSMRRWLITKVGLDETGRAKPAVIFFDYFKLTQSGDMGKEMAEYQSMGFMATAIKNLMEKYDARCVAFVQLNRGAVSKEGQESEDESVIAQSDRLSWFSTSFSILKWLNTEEYAQVGSMGYTHKVINVLSRHGGRQKPGEFIYIKSDTDRCYMEEGPGKDELTYRQSPGVRVPFQTTF